MDTPLLTTRRRILACAAAAVLPACTRRKPSIATPSGFAALRFAPVNVSADRVIRTITGLRPFRPSGFVVKRESVGSKTVVHNYGHGGGGMTLSWGTSHLAVNLAEPQPGGSVAVLGSGGVGLATARLLQRRGARVTIYAKSVPPETTSNIAGAQWWPTSVFDFDRSTPEFRDEFVRAARLSYREYQNLPGDRYGIHWVRNYLVADHPIRDQFILGPESPLRDLYPEYADLPENATPFGRYARRFTTMMIEPPVYLNAMIADFLTAGGRIEIRAFGTAGDLQRLAEPLIVNCTGLGSGQLFGDSEIVPVKGQLTVVLPQPEVDYNLLSGGLYMFPRRDGILLGGTFERGNSDLTPDRETEASIIRKHQELFASVSRSYVRLRSASR